MREQIVDHVCKDAAPDQVSRARAAMGKRGNIADLLVSAGFPPGKVLEACCSITGLPPAPLSWLRDPNPPHVDGIDGELCARLGCAPVASTGGRLCIAYADPEIAAAHDTLGLPPHQPYLALKAQLERALSLMPTGDDAFSESTRAMPTGELATSPVKGIAKTEDNDDDDLLFSDVVPRAEAPVDEDAATIAMSREQLRQNDANDFEDPTQAVSALTKQPPAPAPAPRPRRVPTVISTPVPQDTPRPPEPAPQPRPHRVPTKSMVAPPEAAPERGTPAAARPAARTPAAARPAARPPPAATTVPPLEMPLEDLLSPVSAQSQPEPQSPAASIAFDETRRRPKASAALAVSSPSVPVISTSAMDSPFAGAPARPALDSPPTPATAEVAPWAKVPGMSLPQPERSDARPRPAAAAPATPAAQVEDLQRMSSLPRGRNAKLQVQSFRDVEGSLPTARPLAAESLDPFIPPPPEPSKPVKRVEAAPVKRGDSGKSSSSSASSSGKRLTVEGVLSAADLPMPGVPAVVEPAPAKKKAKKKDGPPGAPGSGDIVAEIIAYKYPLLAAAAFVVLIVIAVSNSGSGPIDTPPLPATGISGDGREDLTTRQNQLVAQGRAEKNPQTAIRLFTQAISLNPNAPGARDGFLERARRSIVVGDFTQAEQDLLLLKRRLDAESIEPLVTGLIADLDKARKSPRPPPAPHAAPAATPAAPPRGGK